MNIALLNTRITIQNQTVETDDIGNHVDGWQDYLTCHASISGESGSENFNAGKTNDHAAIAFTVRWSRKTAAVTTTGYRIIWNGDIYNLLSVDHLSNKRNALKFTCRKERN